MRTRRSSPRDPARSIEGRIFTCSRNDHAAEGRRAQGGNHPPSRIGGDRAGDRRRRDHAGAAVPPRDRPLRLGAAGRQPEAGRRRRARGRPRMPRGDRPDPVARRSASARSFRRPATATKRCTSSRRPACGRRVRATRPRIRTKTRTSRRSRSRWPACAAMIASGEIVDLKTVAGLSLLQLSRRSLQAKADRSRASSNVAQ